MFKKILNAASIAMAILSLVFIQACSKDPVFNKDYLTGLWLVEKSEPAAIPIGYRLEKGDTVRIIESSWIIYGQNDPHRGGVLKCSDAFYCFIQEDGLFKWAKNGMKSVTCTIVKLNRNTFEFIELKNNRRFKMKHLKE